YTCLVGGCNFTPKNSSNTASTTLTQTLPSDDTFSLVPVSKAVTKQTCQLSGSKGWSCRMTTTHVQPPPLGSATVYLEWGGSEIRLESITGRSEEHTSELQSRGHLVCRLLLEKKKKK